MDSGHGHKIVISLAYFIRYGYFVVMIIALWYLKKANVTGNMIKYTFFGMLILYGLYFLLGLLLRFNHLYCAMQNAYRLKMMPYNASYFTDKMKKDIKFIGIFFLLMGVIGVLSVYFVL